MIIQEIAEQYTREKHQFPSDSIKNKGADFFRMVSEAIMHDYITNQCLIPYQTKSRSISELRSYAKGEQNVNKYKPLLCTALAENKNKAYMNISWEPVRAIPKFRNVIKGLAIKTAFKLNINALDPSSITEKKAEEAYWRLQTDPEWIAFSKHMQQMGVRTPKQQFETEEQVDMWIKSGGVKLGVEIAMKVALEATLYLSKFEDSVKVQLIDDLIDIGIIGIRDYVEAGTGYVKARYVDPEYYVGRFSQFLDNHNSDYGAELRFMTIGEIRRESDLSDTELSSIAKRYQKQYGNMPIREGVFNTNYTARYKDIYGCLPIDDMKVPVLDGVYICSDTDYYTKAYKSGNGNLMFDEVGPDYKLSEKEKSKPQKNGKGKSLEQRSRENIYKFKHIVGSDVVFSFGEDNHITHDGPDGFKTAVNPYHVCRIGTSSIVDLLVGKEDDACLSTYKWRNAKARMMPPPGVYIEKGILENITLGGVKMSPKQSVAMGLETGYLVGQSLSDHGRSALSANSAPIIPLPNTIGDYFNVYLADMNHIFSQMRELTGINDLTAGSDPPERQGLGVAKIAIASSNNTLLPLFKAYEVCFEQTMRSCMKRWQAVLRNGDVKGHYKAIGSTNIEVFKLTKDLSLAEMGITLEAMPGEEEKQFILHEIAQLKAANVANGSGGITPDNWLLIYRTVMSGNLDLAYLQLNWALQEQKKQDHRLAMEREQMNAKVQQESNQGATLAKQAIEEQMFSYKKEEMLLQEQIDSKARRESHEYTMREIEAKGDNSIEAKLIGEQGSLTKELIKQKKEKLEKK